MLQNRDRIYFEVAVVYLPVLFLLRMYVLKRYSVKLDFGTVTMRASDCRWKKYFFYASDHDFFIGQSPRAIHWARSVHKRLHVHFYHPTSVFRGMDGYVQFSMSEPTRHAFVILIEMKI